MASKAARLSISADDGSGDRISKLPDEIICHILSYLPTECSVRTRILSTRWKYLFTFVPVLDFFGPLNCITSETFQPFQDFVSFVFNSYNVSRMDKFFYSSSSLFVADDQVPPRLASWIQDAVNRGVRELDVLETFNKPLTIPKNLFVSENLTLLNLHGNFTLDVPDNVWLPCVRTVDFLGVRFLSDDSARRLFQGFPVLEDLFLNICRMESIQVLHICNPSLSSLKIHGIQDEFELVLDVPNVKYFEYHGFESLGFCTRSGLKSLVNASVSFWVYTYAGFEAFSRLVSNVSHVRLFQLSASVLEAFRRFGRTLPTFCNLTDLELSVTSTSEFKLDFVVDLLDKTPHLAVLVIDNGCSSEFYPSYSLPEHVPMCVSTYLKVLGFKGFSLLVYECKLLEYFLKNAKVLHKLNIQTREESLKTQYEISKKLLTFSRCSKTCQVFLDSFYGREQ